MNSSSLPTSINNGHDRTSANQTSMNDQGSIDEKRLRQDDLQEVELSDINQNHHDNNGNDISKTNGISVNSPSKTTGHYYNNEFENDTEEEDDDEEAMFQKLLPPEPDYHGNNDEDLDALLGIELNTIDKNGTSSKSRSKTKQQKCRIINNNVNKNETSQKYCVRKFGRTIILNTSFYQKKKCGLMGPHYVGVICTIGLLSGGSSYFTKRAFEGIGVKSGLICLTFTTMAFVNLFRTVCVDPGIVKMEDQLVRRKKKRVKVTTGDTTENDSDKEDAGENSELEDEYETVNIGEEQGWRYCRACSLYQPPKAVHCPDCDVCVDGYDHHCPWMGTCIGKKNMSSFMKFNFTWLIFLIYSGAWVLAIGPLTVTTKKEN